MWKRAALPFTFVLFWGAPVLALNGNGLRNKFVEVPQPTPVATSPYVVDGLALGAQAKSGNQPNERYQCNPSDAFPGFISCNEEHTTPGKEVTRSHSILQSQDGTAYYVNSYFDPAFFDPNEVQDEINRMSSEFGEQARVIQMPPREGLPNAVMALWGAIKLEPLKPDETSTVASGDSYPGVLVSFLGDLERSAKAGVPVYRLGGSAGFLWVATFDQSGKGVLRYLAIDDSKIEPSRQIAANSDNQAQSNSNLVNAPAVMQPDSQQQPRSDAEDKQRLAEATGQQAQSQPSADAQNQKQATIIEIALAILVLLCAAVMAVFLRKKRQAMGSV
ncbi:MAG TPA: hypothetical protein VH985_21075 [Candidatus Binatia bacterium]